MILLQKRLTVRLILRVKHDEGSVRCPVNYGCMLVTIICCRCCDPCGCLVSCWRCNARFSDLERCLTYCALHLLLCTVWRNIPLLGCDAADWADPCGRCHRPGALTCVCFPLLVGLQRAASLLSRRDKLATVHLCLFAGLLKYTENIHSWWQLAYTETIQLRVVVQLIRWFYTRAFGRWR